MIRYGHLSYVRRVKSWGLFFLPSPSESHVTGLPPFLDMFRRKTGFLHLTISNEFLIIVLERILDVSNVTDHYPPRSYLFSINSVTPGR